MDEQKLNYTLEEVDEMLEKQRQELIKILEALKRSIEEKIEEFDNLITNHQIKNYWYR